VSQCNPLSRALLVVDDHILDVLSRMNRQTLVAGSLQRRYVLGVLRVAFEGFGDTVLLD
jgi:hypothetical protein